MIFRNTQTQARMKCRFPRTLFMIFGGFYFLFLFRPRAFVKYLLLDALTMFLHRYVNVFFMDQILEKELKGPWVIEDKKAVWDWIIPGGQILCIILGAISGL